MDADDRLRLDYEQTSQLLRTLTDIRFRLIAFVPTFAGVSVALFAQPRPAVELLAIGTLGLVATFGIYLYELKNSQLYAAAAGRARELERRLELSGGDLDTHDRGLSLVYGAALAGWSYIVGWGLLRALEPRQRQRGRPRDRRRCRGTRHRGGEPAPLAGRALGHVPQVGAAALVAGGADEIARARRHRDADEADAEGSRCRRDDRLHVPSPDLGDDPNALLRPESGAAHRERRNVGDANGSAGRGGAASSEHGRQEDGESSDDCASHRTDHALRSMALKRREGPPSGGPSQFGR